MKPINEYTLQECLKSLRQMDSDLYEYGLHIALADRIHELTRWIPVGERLPTEGDADENGFVDIYGKMGRYDMPWNSVGKVNSVTHWKRIDKP